MSHDLIFFIQVQGKLGITFFNCRSVCSEKCIEYILVHFRSFKCIKGSYVRLRRIEKKRIERRKARIGSCILKKKCVQFLERFLKLLNP